MRPGRADPELDDLIAEIIIDAYDEDEALIGFENASTKQTASPVQAPPSARTSKSCPSPPPTAAAN